MKAKDYIKLVDEARKTIAGFIEQNPDLEVLTYSPYDGWLDCHGQDFDFDSMLESGVQEFGEFEVTRKYSMAEDTYTIRKIFPIREQTDGKLIRLFQAIVVHTIEEF